MNQGVRNVVVFIVTFVDRFAAITFELKSK